MTFWTSKVPPKHPLLCELARHRVSLSKPDRRTSAERTRDNDEMLRQLEGRIAPDFQAQLVELLAGRGVDWRAEVERFFGKERMLDVCEALAIVGQERSRA